jgi:hypothetical protein
MHMAKSDQAAIRGQLLTKARPGTKKVNIAVKSTRSMPVRSVRTKASSTTATVAATRSSTSARCSVGTGEPESSGMSAC